MIRRMTTRVYLGTYTGPHSKGIYLSGLATDTGELAPPALVAELAHPTFVALDPAGRRLYAASETYDDNNGSVAAFAVDRGSGGLTPLNTQPSHGGGPCYVEVDRTGRCVLVANFGGGSVAVYPIDADGRLRPATATVNHGRDGRRAHAHCITTSPDNRFALAVDLGRNKTFVYRLDPAAGTLAPNTPDGADAPPGAGPRHVRLHPTLPVAYVVNELDATVSVYDYDAGGGVLTAVETVPMLPPDYAGKRWAAELVVHPSGRFVYASNRAHESIACYAVDGATGLLTPRGHVGVRGRTPRGFAVDPSGRWLVVANQESDNVVVFRIDPRTGALAPAGDELTVGSPVCVRFA